MTSDTTQRPGSLAIELVGTWQLVSRTDRTSSGQRRVEPSLGEDPIALLYYDRTGHFAAQFMKRDRTAAVADAAGTAPNNSRARGGYDAYFGSYAVDEQGGTVTHRLVGALSAENVGQSLTRVMKVSGSTLTISLATATSQGEAVMRTLVWTRVA
jgi:hypothetical protein